MFVTPDRTENSKLREVEWEANDSCAVRHGVECLNHELVLDKTLSSILTTEAACSTLRDAPSGTVHHPEQRLEEG